VTIQGEIRPGYKQTDVGVFPKDWDVVHLGEIGSFSKGQGIRKDQANSGSVPCVRYGEIYTFHHEIIREFRSHISPDIAKTSKKLKVGDILFAGSGETKAEIGKCVAFLDNIETFAGGDIVILSPTRGDSRLLGYLLNTPAVARQKASKGQGDAVVHISATALSTLVFALPSSEKEQRAIAAALADADAFIAALEGMIAKKRDLKQAAMQHLLTGKTRLPGFSGEWEVKRLGEVAAIRNHKINTFGADAAAFCVELEQVGQNTGQIDGHSDARSRRSVKYLFQKGDVLFGRLRPYLRKFWWANRDGVCSTEIWPLIPIGDRLVSGFLFQTLQTDAFIEAANSSYGTHMPRSDWKALTKFEFNLPTDPNEQTAIAEVLSDMDADLAALEAQAAKARAVKQGVMQELLTGKVRLV